MIRNISFCIKCGQAVEYKQPDCDNRLRATCLSCNHIEYENPRVVVGAVCIEGDKTLMCRRDIDPRRGFWTIPAGFLELNESTEEGARREANEEALAEIKIDRLLAIFNIPRVAQVQIIYLAHLKNGKFGVGEETSEIELCSFKEALEKEIAFPTVRDALTHAHKIITASVSPLVLQKTYI